MSLRGGVHGHIYQGRLPPPANLVEGGFLPDFGMSDSKAQGTQTVKDV